MSHFNDLFPFMVKNVKKFCDSFPAVSGCDFWDAASTAFKRAQKDFNKSKAVSYGLSEHNSFNKFAKMMILLELNRVAKKKHLVHSV